VAERDGSDRRSVLIAGYYGHRNLGDEAILRIMLEELRRASPQLDVTVVSSAPAETTATHNVNTVHERDVPAILEVARGCDLIIVGGGGLFHDYQGVQEPTLLSRWHWGLTYYAAFPLFATLFRKRLFIAAAGVGPLQSDAGRRYTRLVFERADVATVRDVASRDVLAGLGVDTARVEVTADPAWMLHVPDRAEGLARLARLGLPHGSRVVAVGMRHWALGVEADWHKEVAAALDALVESRYAVPVFLPFQSEEDGAPSDLAVARRIRALMRHGAGAVVAPPDLAPEDVQGLIAGADLMLAMRMHAVILAGNAALPTVALAYDPKVVTAMKQVGQGARVIDLRQATAAAILEQLERAVDHREQITAEIRQARASLRSAASRTWRIAADMLAARDAPVREPSADLTDLLCATFARDVRRAELHESNVTRLTALLAAESRDVAGPDATGFDHAAAHAAAEARIVGLTDQLAVAARNYEAAAREVAILRFQLVHIARTKAYRAAAWFWRLRASLAPSAWFSRPRASRVPSDRPQLRPRQMSLHEFAFDRFKRERRAAAGDELAGLRTPCEAGLVSVILPAFNGADLMCEAIDSILTQTHTRLELIIVNDGSTDGTAAIADEYARVDSRVRVIHQENRKLPRALSEGMRHARGEFLTWTSCDNRLKPHCLERLVADLSARPTCDMIYANIDIIDADGHLMRGAGQYDAYQRPPGSGHVHLPSPVAELNTWANNYVGSAFLYRRRAAWLLGGYSPFRFLCEDYDYWMRLNALLTLRHASFAEPVYEYRFHGGSLTARWEELGMIRGRDRLMVFEEFRRDFYLSPMLWVVDGDDAELVSALKTQIRRAGHLWYQGQFPLTQLPRFWVPVVHVRAAAAPGAPGEPRSDLPDSALRVLATRAAALPAAAAAAWQMCVTTEAGGQLPELAAFAQGWLGAAGPAQMFRAIDIRARSEHLAVIEREIESRPAPGLKASVVICSHRSGDRVLRAIRSALGQSMPPDRYEVLIVNNAPDRPGLDRAVQQLRAGLPPADADRVRLIACPMLGLSAARNAGIAEARGEIICLLDDDAVAEPQWLERLCAAYDAHPEAGVIGGHVRLHIPTPRPASLRPGWEKYWSQLITRFTEYTEVDHWTGYPWGANWSARRAALLDIGGFRLRYGRVGDNFWGGEEVIAAALAQRLGWRIAITPDAVVLHDVDPSRFTHSHVRRTLVAVHCVAYLTQRDLYLPMERGLRSTLRQLTGVFVDPDIPGRTGRLVDAAFRKYAQVRLLALQLADLRRRRRPSALEGDPPMPA
jgi:polysaccharide pyruvyl transferase CsaB